MSQDTFNSEKFKVVSISEGTNAFGLSGHILIAKSGEAWEVGRNRGPHNPAWDKGDIITIKRDKNNSLMWHLYSVEIPRRIQDAPEAVIAKVWEGNDE